MPQRSYRLNIDKKEVLRSLGYNDSSKISGKILKEIDEVLEDVHKIIEPRVFYKKYKFALDEETKSIMVENGARFDGEYVYENLKDCDYLITAIATLGDRLERKSTEGFETKDYLKGYVYDAAGICALNLLNKMFWLEIIDEIKDEGFGITRKFCPGTGSWDITGQGTIYKLLDGEIKGVTINEYCAMYPVKSDSMLYGIGKKIGISKVLHDCNDCGFINCRYRQTGEKKHRVTVKRGNEETDLEANDGESLYKTLSRNNIYTSALCAGNHTCGKCRVRIYTKKEIPMGEDEKNLLLKHGAEDGIRLSCFIKVNQDMTVEIPDDKNRKKIMVDGVEGNYDINPYVKKKSLKVNNADLSNQRADLLRLKDSLKISDAVISPKVLSELPVLLKEKSGIADCVLMDSEILSLRGEGGIYGVAVDIGTTTIAAYLIDLETGKQIDVLSSLNPQRVYGGDVISRINHTISNENGIDELKRLIVDEINKIVNVFCERHGIMQDNIYMMTFAGNTTMIHMLLGVSAGNIANAPFIPVFTDSIKLKARDHGLNINSEGYMITLPCLSGYIGADTIAAVLACGVYENDEICLMLDIGTNGEIVLGNRDRMICCSSAAGPAFEGASITFGTGGVEGAIDHIDLKGAPIFTTIYNRPPVGICGSGIVDGVSEFLKYEIINDTGRMAKKGEYSGDFSDRISEYRGSSAFILDFESGVCITQRDIRELQLAKAAIYAGIRVLIKSLKISVDDIKKVYIAGGFGNYISIDSAISIGLIPGELRDRIIPAGNAAGMGAKMAMIDKDIMKKLEQIKCKMKYIELSCSEEFQSEFINAMNFKKE